MLYKMPVDIGNTNCSVIRELKYHILTRISLIIQNLCYPNFYYPNFQISNFKPTLPTPFKPVILGFPLSDLSIIRPNCYSPKRDG